MDEDVLREDVVRDVVRSIAAGTPIDWPALESSAPDDRARDAVSNLQIVSRIASFHRALQECSAPDEMSSPDALAAEPVTWGPLVLSERIGAGSFGEVYRAWDRRLDREVALKVLRHVQVGEPDAGVVHEGRLLGRVRHPNVVTVYGADVIDGHVGIWMEFIRGRTVEALRRDGGPFDWREAAAVGIAVCRALGAVHEAGLVHRDVTAQNVMRADDGRIVLMDFGAGHQGGDGVIRVVGTPLYLAP